MIITLFNFLIQISFIFLLILIYNKQYLKFIFFIFVLHFILKVIKLLFNTIPTSLNVIILNPYIIIIIHHFK